MFGEIKLIITYNTFSRAKRTLYLLQIMASFDGCWMCFSKESFNVELQKCSQRPELYIGWLKFKWLREPHYLFYDFDYNGVLFKTHGCSNNQQLCSSASWAFFVQIGGRGKREKEKKNFHMLTFTQWFFFNCTLLFNLPSTNAFKSRTGGILLNSCLVPDQVSWLLWPCSLALSYLTNCIIPFIPYVKHATRHLDLEWQKEHTDMGMLPPGPVFKGLR